MTVEHESDVSPRISQTYLLHPKAYRVVTEDPVHYFAILAVMCSFLPPMNYPSVYRKSVINSKKKQNSATENNASVILLL